MNTPSPTAKAPTAPNKPVGEGCIINGEIVIWDCGDLRPVSPIRAWNEWFSVVGSPIPQSQARAQTLRSALDQIGYLQ